MLSIDHCRKKLGRFGKNKSDEKIEAIRNKPYAICDLVIERVVKKMIVLN